MWPHRLQSQRGVPAVEISIEFSELPAGQLANGAVVCFHDSACMKVVPQTPKNLSNPGQVVARNAGLFCENELCCKALRPTQR